MKHCTGRNGTYVCEKPEGHTDAHACYVRGGVARWFWPYDDLRVERPPLRSKAEAMLGEKDD